MTLSSREKISACHENSRPPRSEKSNLKFTIFLQGLRYLLVGGLSFIVDFGLLWIFRELLDMYVWLASALAFAASFAVNFTLQKYFAFASSTQKPFALWRYSALVVINLILTSALVQLFALTGVGWELGKIIVTLMMVIWNFFLYRYWVFRTQRGDNADPSLA